MFDSNNYKNNINLLISLSKMVYTFSVQDMIDVYVSNYSSIKHDYYHIKDVSIKELKLQYSNSFEYKRYDDPSVRWNNYNNQDVIIIYAKDVSYILNLYRDLYILKHKIVSIHIVIDMLEQEFMDEMVKETMWKKV